MTANLPRLRPARGGLSLALSATITLWSGCATGDRPPAESSAAAASVSASARVDAGAASRRDSAARAIVAFLQGKVALDTGLLADSVTLRVAREGGGGERALARARLVKRDAWVVTSGGTRRSFALPPSLTRVETRDGRHFTCRPSDLDSAAPRLGAYPHVGVLLSADSAAGCMQTRSITVVFDSAAPGRVRAVVYDQWEW